MTAFQVRVLAAVSSIAAFSGLLVGPSRASGTTEVLQPPADPSGQGFGNALDADGDRIAVGASGAYGNNRGAAFVFERAGGAWDAGTLLVAPDGEAHDRFGTDVALSGDTAVVGSPFDGTTAGAHAGSAYVYERDAGGWSFRQKLRPADGVEDQAFGISLALDGDVAAFATNDQELYLFERTAGTWAEVHKVVLGSTVRSIDLSEATVVVGTPFVPASDGPFGGAARVFVRGGTT